MSLNVELIRKVRDAIADEGNVTGFGMGMWLTDAVGTCGLTLRDYGKCGTVACIAGHAVGISRARVRSAFDTFGDRARRALAISEEDADYLFMGEWSSQRNEFGDVELDEITREEAVAYLDRCIAAGEIVR